MRTEMQKAADKADLMLFNALGVVARFERTVFGRWPDICTAIRAARSVLREEMHFADREATPPDHGEVDHDRARLNDAAPELLAALEPFSEVPGEGDEDFPDDTKVTVSFGRTTHYALTLGDLRRAAKAVAKAEGF